MQEAMEDEKIQASKVRHSSLEHPRMTRSQLQTKTGFYSMRSTAAGVNRTSSTAYNGRHTAETEPSFVFKSFDVPDGFKRRVNYDRLMKKPAFKPQTQKFDKNALIQERTVTILTKEDKFSKFDMPWISKLRVKDNLEVIKLSKQLTSTIPAPPSFYESDLKKTLKNSPKNNNRLCNFNNVDFDSNGNTNELNHLINPFGKYTPTRTYIFIKDHIYFI